MAGENFIFETFMHGRAFNTIEEAVEAWKKEAEARAEKEPKSGILCKCQCYRREDKIKYSSPVGTCTLLLPEEVYNDYLKWTDERFKDVNYEFPYVAVISPGRIRVRFYSNSPGLPGDDYMIGRNLCDNKLRVEWLLEKYLGKKIRLGKNILVK